MGSLLSSRGYIGVLSMNSLEPHSISTVWVEDQHFLLFKLITAEYLEGIHQRIGVKEKGIIIFILKMKMRGYFLLITKLNLKFSLIKKIQQFVIDMKAWFFLGEDGIFTQKLTVLDLK